MRKNKSGAMSLHALLFVTLAVVSSDSQRDQVSSRILGGEPVEPGEFPSMVAIAHDGFIICAGSVIDNRHILTAAHCIDKGNSNHTIKLGCNTLRGCTGPIYQVNYMVHPSYFVGDLVEISPVVNIKILNDIAILRTNRPIQFTEPEGLGSIGAISFPNSTQDDYRKGDLLTAVGWGRRSTVISIFPSSKPLMKTSLTATDCGIKSNLTNTEDVICTLTPGANICPGDSGGPLIKTLPDGSKSLVGIASRGWHIGCTSELGSAFTRVGAYFDWIEESKRIWDNELM